MEQQNQPTKDRQQKGKHENPLPQEISNEQRRLTEAAHREAEEDIAADADLSLQGKNDDLDEGESARLGEDVPV